MAIGISIWLVAAVSLVAGIVIGFASGYTAGQRATVIQSTVSDNEPVEPAGRSSEPPERPSTSQTFTESPVAEPVDRVRVDPPPIVPSPAPPPVAAEPPASAPASRARRQAPEEPAASGPGSLQVLSRPSGAQVFVDGRVVGRTPLVMPDVRGGAHDVRIELAGFRRWATSVQVSPGARTRVAASLEQ